MTPPPIRVRKIASPPFSKHIGIKSADFRIRIAEKTHDPPPINCLKSECPPHMHSLKTGDPPYILPPLR